MLKMNTVMVCSKQSEVLASFYEKVLEKPADMVDKNEGFYGWQVGSFYFMVLNHSEKDGKTTDPGRVLLNFQTEQVKEDFERIKAAGAGVIAEPYEMNQGWVATLADPDGNYFQLVSPMDM